VNDDAFYERIRNKYAPTTHVGLAATELAEIQELRAARIEANKKGYCVDCGTRACLGGLFRDGRCGDCHSFYE